MIPISSFTKLRIIPIAESLNICFFKIWQSSKLIFLTTSEGLGLLFLLLLLLRLLFLSLLLDLLLSLLLLLDLFLSLFLLLDLLLFLLRLLDLLLSLLRLLDLLLSLLLLLREADLSEDLLECDLMGDLDDLPVGDLLEVFDKIVEDLLGDLTGEDHLDFFGGDC